MKTYSQFNQPFSTGFPELTDDEWKRLARSHEENINGSPLSDREWERRWRFRELNSARTADNYANNSSNHFLEVDVRGGYRVYAPENERAHYFDLKFWRVDSVCGPYLWMVPKL